MEKVPRFLSFLADAISGLNVIRTFDRLKDGLRVALASDWSDSREFRGF
jgi:hypothetical protein